MGLYLFKSNPSVLEEQESFSYEDYRSLQSILEQHHFKEIDPQRFRNPNNEFVGLPAHRRTVQIVPALTSYLSEYLQALKPNYFYLDCESMHPSSVYPISTLEYYLCTLSSDKL